MRLRAAKVRDGAVCMAHGAIGIRATAHRAIRGAAWKYHRPSAHTSHLSRLGSITYYVWKYALTNDSICIDNESDICVVT